MQLAQDGRVAEGGLDIRELLRVKEDENHGWWMWSAWYLAGILLLVTKRYAKKSWTLSHYLHAILGYYTLIVTIVWSFKVIEWRFDEVHYVFGTITLFVTMLGSLSGIFTVGVMKFYNGDKDWAEKEKVEVIAKIHRFAGYFMLLIGNITIANGCFKYFDGILQGDQRKLLGFASFFSFVLMVIIAEAIYRIRNKFSLGHIKTPQVVDGGKF